MGFFKRNKPNRAHSFKRRLFGYDMREVREFTERQCDVAATGLAEQKNRINELKAELAMAESTVATLKERENSISEILFVAADKANELETDLKIQYALEIERLKIFQAKWTNAYETLRDKYAFDEDVNMMEALVVETSLQLERALYNDFGIGLTPKNSKIEQHFKDECARLAPDGEQLYSLIESLKKSLHAEDGELQKIEDLDELAEALDITA